ncbi:MAG TPA: hypothetical protein VHS34_12905 [Terriglobales bacterium]|nr:hypothetical protein [Terriglobales bacterium]
MLKKAALSLFGLAVMLVCINPPQANAGVIVQLGPTYPRPVYVRPYPYVAPSPYVAYGPNPYVYGPVFARPHWDYPGYYRPVYRPGYWGPRRFEHREFEHREFVGRRPYWRR